MIIAWMAMCAVTTAGLTGCASWSKPAAAKLETLTNAPASAQLQTAWVHNAGAQRATSTLSLIGAQLITASQSGQISLIDGDSGKTQLGLSAGQALATVAGSDARFVSVVTQSNELLTFENGRLLWKKTLPAKVVTAPLVAGERVFVLSMNRSVMALDALDGKKLWHYNKPSDPLTLEHAGVITAVGDTLWVGLGSRFVALDPLQGSVRAEVLMAVPRGSNEVERLADLVAPVARVNTGSGALLCARAFQLGVGCIEATQGKTIWFRPQSGVHGVAADADIVVGADAADRLMAWNTRDGQVVWRADQFAYRGLSAPALLGDYVHVGDAQGFVHLVSRTSGKTVHRISLGSDPIIDLAVQDHQLLVLQRSGKVTALRAP